MALAQEQQVDLLVVGSFGRKGERVCVDQQTTWALRVLSKVRSSCSAKQSNSHMADMLGMRGQIQQQFCRQCMLQSPAVSV
jgi:precorrin-6x reductase